MIQPRSRKRIPVISLFSGAMGFDLGLEKEGFEVVVAVECDPQAVATIKLNRPKIKIFDRRIEEITTQEILEAAGLTAGGEFVVIGGPCCQSFSTAGQRQSLGDPRGGLFRHFVRVVRESQPKFFVMENVKGMLSAAVSHRPLSKRGPGFRPLTPDEELGSAFRVVVRELKRLRYYVVFDLLNAADYGVPQCRERVFFIGSRDGTKVEMPVPTHSSKATGTRKRWVSLRSAIGRLKDPAPVASRLGRKEARYLKRVPPGGNWRSLPKHLQRKALGRAFVSWGGRTGFLRRLAWDRPSPALTTRPDCKATMLCHPSRLGPLSLKEYSRIQQFPRDWRFVGTVSSQYRQIGNAVPVGLGVALGKAIAKAWRSRRGVMRLGTVETLNLDLARRMADRPVTVMNPPRMRKKGNKSSAIAWAATARRRRVNAKFYAGRSVPDSIPAT